MTDGIEQHQTSLLNDSAFAGLEGLQEVERAAKSPALLQTQSPPPLLCSDPLRALTGDIVSQLRRQVAQ